MSVAEAVAGIDGEWIAARAAEMVQIPSVTMDERAVCDYYRDALRALGLDVVEREVTPGRRNLYACLRGRGKGPSLALNGHLDTIPIGAAWPYRREGDRLYGRGTEDMKGPMAAVLGAAKAILETGLRLQGDLWLTAVVGHEEAEAKKDGPRALVADVNEGRLPVDRILIVEGPEAIWLMSMGSAVFSITLESDLGGSHTNNVPFGENPVRFMGELIGTIHARQQEMDRGARHRLAGAERIDLGIAQAGDYHNRTPVRCYLEGTRRWLPGRSAADIARELEEMTQPVAAAGRLRHRIELTMDREPFEIPADDPCVAAVARAAERVNGRPAELVGKRIVGDANIYVHGTGKPAFYYGAAYATAHADVEWVSVAALERAAKVYVAAAADYCGVG